MIFRFIFAAAFAVLSANPASFASSRDEHCSGRGSAVVIDVDAHAMWLCEQDKVFQEYRVALGRGGVDKKEEGDRKTPLGEYSLGTPRASTRFGTFIPVGYPTPDQREKGYTGSAIGIHGPDRRFTWLGRLTSWVDWTSGCIAVGKDEEIESVAQWVRDKGVTRISIESSR